LGYSFSALPDRCDVRSVNAPCCTACTCAAAVVVPTVPPNRTRSGRSPEASSAANFCWNDGGSDAAQTGVTVTPSRRFSSAQYRLPGSGGGGALNRSENHVTSVSGPPAPGVPPVARNGAGSFRYAGGMLWSVHGRSGGARWLFAGRAEDV